MWSPSSLPSVNIRDLPLLRANVWQPHVLVEAPLDEDVVVGGPVAVRDLGPHRVALLIHELLEGVLVVVPLHPDVFDR